MSFKPSHFRECIVIPTLEYLDLYSPDAVELLMGTAAQESQLGVFLKQIKGPALGVYQMEPATYKDIMDNFLRYKPDLQVKVLELSGAFPLWPDEIKGNLYVATALARVHYLRVSTPLPDAKDIVGMARYWKNYYNTSKGRGTTFEFVRNYKRYVLEQDTDS